MIHHSLLRPELTEKDVKEGCKIARDYTCISVCVKPSDVVLAKAELEGTKVLITTVIGFPHGANTTATKVFEAKEALKDGAVELDMVLNIGKMLSGDYEYVEHDIKAVCDVAHKNGAIVKVILENCYLTNEQKVKACQLCESAGADFVKTSSGFGTAGATLEDLQLMRQTCSPEIHVKAAGGVRTLDRLLEVRSAGAVRSGATATVAILEEARKRAAAGTL
jgi:deoxyribose-phosphate aldolase